MSAPENQVVIIGAGPAGLAAAVCLSDLSVKSVVLDRGDRVVAHLEEHADERGIELRLDTPVERVVRRKPGGWGVVTPDGTRARGARRDGDRLRAHAVAAGLARCGVVRWCGDAFVGLSEPDVVRGQARRGRGRR